MMEVINRSIDVLIVCGHFSLYHDESMSINIPIVICVTYDGRHNEYES